MQPSNLSVVNLIYRRAQNHNAETNICGFLKMLTLYWFSIFKRKIYRGLDTWKNVRIYIKCLSPELSLGKHPLCGYLKVLECVPFLSVAPPQSLNPFFCVERCLLHLQVCPVQAPEQPWLGERGAHLLPACRPEPALV